MRLLLLLVAVLGVAACVQSEVYTTERAVERSIMVPPGLGGAAGGLKNVFRDAGWTTYVTGTSAQTTGSAGQYVNLNTRTRYPARYSALLASDVVDLCLDFSRYIAFDISILDNVTGQEVAAFTGTACERSIERRLREELASFL
jgi:hypothetical protein